MTRPATLTVPAGARDASQVPALRLQGVAKHYGGRPVLRGIDLDVAEGESVALLGPNGCGKSTLLRIAACLAPPDAGQVIVDGQDGRAAPHEARAALTYLPQEPATYAELTPAEHVAFWSRLRGVSLDAQAHVAAAGLALAANRPAAGLSRGQRQRLALAMAFVDLPPLIVLDEPFTALDDDGARNLEDRIAALRSRGHALLLALHDASHARRLADRVLRLHHGKLEVVA